MAKTPNMNIGLSVPGSTPGPEWAEKNNNALETLDAHDHTAGKGAQVPSAGIDVNSDFQINGHNLDAVRMVRFGDQESALAEPADKRGISVVGGDLFFNNGSGVPVKITDGASLAASSLGGISGLPSIAYPNAGANFDSSFPGFEFFEATKTFARLKVGDVRIHEAGAFDPHPVVLKSAAGMSGPLELTLPPSAPASNLPLKLSPGGAMVASEVVTADLATNAVTTAKIANDAVTTAKIADGSVTTAKLANNSVTSAKLIRAPFVRSNSCGSWAHTAPGQAQKVTNLAVRVTSVGNPVLLGLNAYDDLAFEAMSNGGTFVLSFRRLLGGGSFDVWAKFHLRANQYYTTASAFSSVIVLPTGSHDFEVWAEALAGAPSFSIENARLISYEV